MNRLDWLRFPSLSALRALEATVRIGSFSGAARALNVTHAAVAQQVRNLEEQLGFSLVHRDGRTLGFTEEGRKLAEAANEGFGTIQAALTDIDKSRDTKSLSVTMSPIFAEKWLVPRLKSFWKRYPDITVSLRPTHKVLDLRREGIDLGIRYGRGSWPGIESTYLTSARFLIVASPELLSSHAAIDHEKIGTLPWVVEEDWQEPLNWLASHGITLSEDSITEFSTEEICLTAARQGIGLYVGTAALVQQDIAEGTLTAIFDPQDENPAYYVVTPTGPTTQEARSFISWLRSQT